MNCILRTAKALSDSPFEEVKGVGFGISCTGKFCNLLEKLATEGGRFDTGVEEILWQDMPILIDLEAGNMLDAIKKSVNI